MNLFIVLVRRNFRSSAWKVRCLRFLLAALLWSSFRQFKSQITLKLSIFYDCFSHQTCFFSSETCRVSPAGTSLLNIPTLVAACCHRIPNGLRFRSVPACSQDARASVLVHPAMETDFQPRCHASLFPHDCHPVHLLVPCYDTCHRLAARQQVVNRDELCNVRTSVLTRWREKELDWFRDTRAGCGF